MFSPQIHRYLFLFGACALGFGMMMGSVPTSVPQFILFGNWLLEMDFQRKLNTLKKNRLFWILSAVFFMHVLGLLYTQDLSAGWNDIRTKVPLMFLAMVFLTIPPLSIREFHAVIYCFLLGSFTNTAWCYIYTFILHKNEVVRSASRYMSHIRLGLYLNIAITCCVYFILHHRSFAKKCFFVFLILYFLFSMYALGLASGFANFFLLCFLALCYLIFRQKLKVKLLLIISILSVFFIMGEYIYSIYRSQHIIHGSDEANVKHRQSPTGRFYFHYPAPSQTENGNLVHINIQFEELKQEWNKRCPDDTFSYDAKINLDRFQVLLRYLASKGLNKDSLAISQLSSEEIDQIKNNVTNYQLPEWSNFHKRIYELVNEYDEFTHNRSVNGHSLSMRLYFWKTALYVIKNHFFTGVGTGDVQAELNQAYKATNAPLTEEWYKRPHNQFLTITVALGIFGFLVFIFTLVYPALAFKKYFLWIYWPFFLIALISFLVEDTLETQAGLTFFAYFNTLFVSMAYYRKSGDAESDARGL